MKKKKTKRNKFENLFSMMLSVLIAIKQQGTCKQLEHHQQATRYLQ